MEIYKNIENIIVMYDYAYINGGAAKVAIESAIALSEMTKYNIYYIAEVGPVCDDLLYSNVNCICFNRKDINKSKKIDSIIKGVWNFKSKKGIEKILKNFNPDTTIIHIHGWSKALSASILRECEKKFKIFITLHDYFVICPNGGIYNYHKKEICSKKCGSVNCFLCNCDKRSYIQKIWRDIRFLVQKKYLYSDKVAYISISELNEEIVRKYIDHNRYFRINNPVEINSKKLERNESEKTFIYVGRISDEKGCELFCKAVTEIKQYFKVKGIVVGNGQDEELLKIKYKQIDFLGWQSMENVYRLISSATALVFPSKWYEGAPLTIIESLILGIPCIVSDCTTAADLINNGGFGYCFKSQSINDLLDKMRRLLDEGNYNFLTNNISTEFDKDKYSKKSHVHKLLSVYENWLNDMEEK